MVEGYYYLGDYASQKDSAIKNLDRVKADDALARAEMMIYAGIAFYYQQLPDATEALKYFDKALQECDKAPEAVGATAVNAIYWSVWISLEQNDEERARKFMSRLQSQPNCSMKNMLMTNYNYLLDK